MFVMHLSSNQTVPNPVRVAYVLMILVPEFQWTRMNRRHASRVSFISSLLIMTFTVDQLSSSIHNVLTAFPDTWVLFPLYRNECLSVPMRMRLSIPVMSESIFFGSLIVSSNPSKNISKTTTLLYVSSSDKLSCIWDYSLACMDFSTYYLLVSGQYWYMCLEFPQLQQSVLKPPGLTLVVRETPSMYSY